jgi:hypothetical protein
MTKAAWLLALSYGPEGPPVILWTGGETVGERPANVPCVLSKGEPQRLLDAVELLLVKGADWNDPSE